MHLILRCHQCRGEIFRLALLEYGRSRERWSRRPCQACERANQARNADAQIPR